MRRIFWVAATLAAAAPAQAADPHRLAFSERMGVEVFANPDAAGAWCRPSMALALSLKDNSPLLQGGIAAFMAKLAPVLDNECPTAVDATIMARKASDSSLVGKPLTARKADKWAAIEAAVPAVVTVDAPTAPVASPVPSLGAPISVAPVPPPAARLRDSAQPASFDALLEQYAKAFPDVVKQDEFLSLYASRTKCGEYTKVANNEFKLNPFLAQVGANLAGHLQQLPPYMKFQFVAKFGEYDGKQQQFEFEPFEANGSYDFDYGWSHDCRPSRVRGLPSSFQAKWDNPGVMSGLPMAAADAEQFLTRRMQRDKYRAREIAVEAVVKPSFARPEYSTANVSFEVVEVTVFADRERTTELMTLSQAQLAETAQKVAEARAEAMRQKQLAEEAHRREQEAVIAARRAEQDRKMLETAGKGTRVAYLHNGGHYLSRTASAIGAALIGNESIPATFLVQAASSGGKDVEARWPGRLRMDVAGGLPELSRGDWYVVSGDLTAETAADGRSPIGRLAVRSLTRCEKPACAEVENVQTIIERRKSASAAVSQ